MGFQDFQEVFSGNQDVLDQSLVQGNGDVVEVLDPLDLVVSWILARAGPVHFFWSNESETWIENPLSSVVTILRRRRENPCRHTDVQW